MINLEDSFWQLRNTGKILQATEVFEKALNSQLEKVKIELMRTSLIRASEGGKSASIHLATLEDQNVFNGKKDFNYYYQKSMNFAAQGMFSDALTQLLKAKPRDSAAQALWSASRLTFLDNLGLADYKTINETKNAILKVKNTSIYMNCKSTIERIESRELFKCGDIQTLMSQTKNLKWNQVYYFCSWASSLSYVEGYKNVSTTGFSQLIADTDFYLRDYRLQTLAGHKQISQLETITTWSEKAERLYLWTWNWLIQPSNENLIALKNITNEFNSWSKADFLTSFELHLIQLSLSWISIYDNRIISRFDRLFEQSSRTSIPSNSIFGLEKTWYNFILARRQKNISASNFAEKAIQNHPLTALRIINFKKVLASLPHHLVRNSTNSSIHVEQTSGLISYSNSAGAMQEIVSIPLARFLVLIKNNKQLSFADLLQECFQIPFYDQDIHQGKVHNLIQRARKLLLKNSLLKTRNQWLFVHSNTCLSISTDPSSYQISPRTKKCNIRTTPTSAKNEYGLTSILKIKHEHSNRHYSRQELEAILKVPKSTLNRYIKVWITRKWLQKNGEGPQVRYRLTLVDS